MPLFMAVRTIKGGVSADEVASANRADLAAPAPYGVKNRRYRMDEERRPDVLRRGGTRRPRGRCTERREGSPPMRSTRCRSTPDRGLDPAPVAPKPRVAVSVDLAGTDGRMARMHDDRVLKATRVISIVIIPVLTAAFVILFVFPTRTRQLWAWEMRPTMTAMVMGAGYLSGAYFFYRAATVGQWHRIALGFVAVTGFAGILALVTVVTGTASTTATFRSGGGRCCTSPPRSSFPGSGPATAAVIRTCSSRATEWCPRRSGRPCSSSVPLN